LTLSFEQRQQQYSEWKHIPAKHVEVFELYEVQDVHTDNSPSISNPNKNQTAVNGINVWAGPHRHFTFKERGQYTHTFEGNGWTDDEHLDMSNEEAKRSFMFLDKNEERPKTANPFLRKIPTQGYLPEKRTVIDTARLGYIKSNDLLRRLHFEITDDGCQYLAALLHHEFGHFPPKSWPRRRGLEGGGYRGSLSTASRGIRHPERESLFGVKNPTPPPYKATSTAASSTVRPSVPKIPQTPTQLGAHLQQFQVNSFAQNQQTSTTNNDGITLTKNDGTSKAPAAVKLEDVEDRKDMSEWETDV
jgi:hypothetical protein